REFDAMLQRLVEARESLLAEQRVRREMEARVAQAEHLASVGTLTAGLAHQIGTPLNVIRGRAERLLRRLETDPNRHVPAAPLAARADIGAGGEPSPSSGSAEQSVRYRTSAEPQADPGAAGDPGERDLRIIAEQIDRISQLVRRMLDFARVRTVRTSPCDLREVLRNAVELLEVRFEQQQIQVVENGESPIPMIPADPLRLQEVFLNILGNAADAMPSGGTIHTEIRQSERTAPQDPSHQQPVLAVRIRDVGTGIAPEHLTRVFDPFFTTKDVGRGTGLGLSVAYGIVREHGGWMEVESNPDRGACFSVYLPCEPVPGHSKRREPSAEGTNS
ncbi:MAG: hypothetical protein KC729_20725, partial [Candidatus Eisenbacteria bacterium]|nr:hypothetical protein [Candidatus Eisenbacteria bacterium]